MFLSTPPSTTSDPYALATLSTISNKHLYLHSSTIHSVKVRQNVYPAYPAYPSMGKLRNAFLRHGSRSHNTSIPLEKTSQSITGENWKKTLTVEMDEQSLEKGLREYLGIAQPFRQKAASMSESATQFPVRARTSNSGKRPAYSRASTKSIKGHASGDNLLRRDMMCSVEEANAKEFVDEQMGEKYQYVTFVKAPSKEYVRLLKLSNYDVTLVPSDVRMTMIEAIMRDYFLNLIPENSDFLICKNSQSNIYSVLFTGKLVPSCKICDSLARFEFSKDLGFQVVCSSPYCTLKVLYRNKLSRNTYDCLWPVAKRPDVDRSVSLKEFTHTPVLSRMIQSGKYKKADFSRVLLDTSSSPTRDANIRPSTTANIMRNSSTGFTRRIIRSNFPSKSPKNLMDQRPNTVGDFFRNGKKGPSNSSSPDMKNSKGMEMFKNFDSKGLLFRRDSENPKVTFEVSEERAEREEKKRVSKSQVVIREGKVNKFVKVDKKATFFNAENGSENKLDNSFEDIHAMVDILSKKSKTGGVH